MVRGLLEEGGGACMGAERPPAAIVGKAAALEEAGGCRVLRLGAWARPELPNP